MVDLSEVRKWADELNGPAAGSNTTLIRRE
jgi:hypothetical protein